MINKIWFCVFAALSAAVPAPAAALDFDGGKGADIRTALSSVEVPVPVPDGVHRTAAEWTIMVFVNGKNNLESYALEDMNEMEMVGSGARLNIVVEAGRMDGYDDSDGDWKGTRRYLITKDNAPNAVTSKVLEDLGRVDMGDYRSLAAFGKWAKANYPAKKYMLIVWNHGSGWDKGLKARAGRGISYDDETNNHITTPQLALALKEMGKVDVYGSDACLMQMPEVDYEIKDHADYIVGSEETEPGDGYPYHTFLKPVAAAPGMAPAELAKAAVDAYSDFYQKQGSGSTQSFIKAAALPGLVAKVDAWVDAVMAAGLKAEVAAARSAAMYYSKPGNKDLYHFVRLVSEKTRDAAVKARSAELLDFIAKDLVQYNRYNDAADSGGGNTFPDSPDDWDYLARGYYGRDYSESHGIAVYLPADGLGAGYTDLAWAAVSKWDEFIAWYQKK